METQEHGEDPRRTARLLRDVIESLSEAIIVKDRDGKVLVFNKAASRHSGKEAADVLGKDATAIFSPEEARAINERDRRVMDSGTAETEDKQLASDGVVHTYRTTKTPYRDESGNIVGVIGITRDITERKQAADAVRVSEQRLRSVLDAIPIGVMVSDQSGNAVLLNPASRGIWGGQIAPASERYAASKGWWHATGKRIEPHEWASQRALKAGQASLNELIDIETFDGVRKTIKNSAVPLRDDAGAVIGAVVINEDYTDVLRLENQFHQAQKMETIGHLAGGVAHDFNNLLSIILGDAQLLLLGPQPDGGRGMVVEIQKAAERAAALTRQLLAFSRRSVLQPRVLDLNDVVRENEKMLRRLIGEDVRLATVLDPALGRTNVDSGQIGQVIMNLAVNSRDAMPSGGELTIETRNAALDEAAVKMDPDAKAGRYVLLLITDNGGGMTPAVRDRLFEPFFTTKGPGKGTGLGLATVYGIVKQSGGIISVQSEPGRGTAFRIYFPVAEGPAAPMTPLPGVASLASGTETVLLVEDEEAVRSMIRNALQQAGYKVLDASGGAQALRLVGEHSGPIQLMITDVVMPEMSGRQLVERLAQVRPEIKVLYLSGYTESAVVRQGVLQSEVAFLQKPFSLTALTNKVRQVLDEPAR